ncbi:MAG: PHB depolymerase family esterase [Phycisphaerae bacterium]|nr:PHB depolymerase family esterase [Phycisphaerae bacterium]
MARCENGTMTVESTGTIGKPWPAGSPRPAGRCTGTVLLLGLGMILVTQCGCPVPQRPGMGQCSRLVEPETKTGYWLYLPEDYVKNNGQRSGNTAWPLVVTLHGLRPYDDAKPQIRSWQEEADRYGLIVVAPELRTCDQLVMPVPLRDPTKWYVQTDEKAILAVMDEVCRRTNADPTRVLLTCFSSGGYLAHYMMNRHPERFTALAAMGANFNEEMIDYTQLPRYRSTKIAVFFGENDFKLCREESLRAVSWYRRYRFDVDARQVSGLGHERRPQLASVFFSRIIGASPKTPPDLASLVMSDVTTGEPARPAGAPRPASLSPAPLFPEDGGRTNAGTDRPRDAGSDSREREPATVAPMEAPTRSARPVISQPPPPPTPRRPGQQPYSNDPQTPDPLPEQGDEPIPGRIELRGLGIGSAPMWVDMRVDLPPELLLEASVLWLANGQPIASSTPEARAILRSPGQHQIEAWVTLGDDRRAIYRETITVLPPEPTTQPAGG